MPRFTSGTSCCAEGKKIYLLPLSNGGIDLKTTNVNDLLRLYGIKALDKQ